jgi:hypothetical protein
MTALEAGKNPQSAYTPEALAACEKALRTILKKNRTVGGAVDINRRHGAPLPSWRCPEGDQRTPWDN